jgi:TPR repeat protein
MDQDEPSKGWFWGWAIALLVACSGAVVGLNIYLKGVDALGSPSGAGEVIGSAIGLWALGGVASVIAYFVRKSSRKTLLKTWAVGCCVVFGLVAFAQTYAPLNNAGITGSKTAADIAFINGDYATAFREWEKLANKGDANSQYNLGRMFYYGQWVKRDVTISNKWFRLAAEKWKLNYERNSAVVQYKLGELYLKGWGVTKDRKTAIKLITLSAKRKFPHAQYTLGVLSENDGVTKDYKAAIKWYRLSADQGYADAQFRMGIMYYHGNGVSKNLNRAFKWFISAAEQGHGNAQSNLGNVYHNGVGVAQDYVRAHMWMNIAASRGEGGIFRDIVAGKMSPSQLETAQRLARECVDKDYKGC